MAFWMKRLAIVILGIICVVAVLSLATADADDDRSRYPVTQYATDPPVPDYPAKAAQDAAEGERLARGAG